MEYTQGSIVATLHTVLAFLDKYAAQLGGLATSGAKNMIAEACASLDAFGREQEDQAMIARMATTKRVNARQALIAEHMRPIANVAAAEFNNYRELTALHMPRLNVNDQALIQKARAMASAARGHEPAFSKGLASVNFADDLETAVKTLEAAAAERAAAVGSRQKATTGLAVETRAARKRLKVIDDLVMAVIKKDPALVKEWKTAKHVVKKAGVARGASQSKDDAPDETTIPSAPATETEPSPDKEAA